MMAAVTLSHEVPLLSHADLRLCCRQALAGNDGSSLHARQASYGGLQGWPSGCGLTWQVVCNLWQLRAQLLLTTRPHKLHATEGAGVKALANQLQCRVQQLLQGLLQGRAG